jgi:hypothetical protein
VIHHIGIIIGGSICGESKRLNRDFEMHLELVRNEAIIMNLFFRCSLAHDFEMHLKLAYPHFVFSFC